MEMIIPWNVILAVKNDGKNFMQNEYAPNDFYYVSKVIVNGVSTI